ncbi:glycosyltransferase family 4 protein [Mycolicibacterium fluoranthenivorans]|uniref:Glycosyltransferase involved in cell wall bisynthesis n=1 Tax=Mycolicibacterium fluoranthenivorans TaxID=258505 RepID=A0A1G4VI31_9MYCO|nr:glycosyltransferase family 4 protein [Mycolicibacterium fluoranthenivorans]SCX07146.1 Glycosyltransferase involved in cell wall bisynthesis [Mycolicibacterium fluoranthenivorans]
MGMRILMIGAYPLEPGVVRGGIESATSTLVPALAARDDVDAVTVLRFHQGDALTSYRREGPKVEVHYLPGQRRLRTVSGSFRDLRRARKLVAQVKPDVVHGQEIGLYGDIAQRCSRQSVVTVHGVTFTDVKSDALDDGSLRGRLRDRLIRRVERRVLRLAKVVVSISAWDSQVLDLPIRGTRVSIPNAAGAEFFALAPSQPTPPTLLFAGVFTSRKNPVGLVNAFARVHMSVPAARLSLVGPQPDLNYLALVRDRLRTLGLQGSVDISGLVDNDRMLAEIANARAVVLFSRQETAPTILAQAMAAGKPVVATRVGGVPEMVQDGETGFLVDSDDEATLADRMVKLLVDQELALDMGRRAHEVALERFTATAVAELTVQAYRKALA